MSRDSRDVLVTDDGYGKARGALAAVRALAMDGFRPSVAVSAPFSMAAASRHAARVIRVPPSRSPGYREALLSELTASHYLTALATSDDALIALGGDGRRFIDKAELVIKAEAAGIASPPSRRFDNGSDLVAAASQLDYPAVIKPVAAHAAGRAENPRDVAHWEHRKEPLLVQPYLTAPQRGVAGLMWKGELLATVHQRHIRLWPRNCGMTCAAETISRDTELEARLKDLLASYDGVFQADFAGPYLLDMNARVYASLSLAVGAGVNLVSMYCRLLRGEEVVPVTARPGVMYRWLDADLRHLYVAWKRREIPAGAAIRTLVPRRGTVLGTESLRDPKPMLARARHAVRKSRSLSRPRYAR